MAEPQAASQAGTNAIETPDDGAMAATDGSPWQSAGQSAKRLLIYVVITTVLMAVVYQRTKPRVDAAAALSKISRINEILPTSLYDNDLLNDQRQLPANNELGQKRPSTLYIGRKQGQPTTLILEAIAPDGYAGEIKLLLAFKRLDGTGNSATANSATDNSATANSPAHGQVQWQLLAARVLEHKETPGLGDYIDPKKDSNKKHPWIAQLSERDFIQTPAAQWAVKKDGGQFDSRAGATITPRAVIKACRRALAQVNAQAALWIALPAGKGVQAGAAEQ